MGEIEVSRSKLEEIKEGSRYLHGTISEEIAAGGDTFEKSTTQLLKFHGTYQEDDRDLRKEMKEKGLGRYYIFMVRTAIPGGALTPDQYLTEDELGTEFGNNSIRITSRQGFQLHSVRKDNLKECIRRINESGRSTCGACGDVVRNIMATPLPYKSPVYDDVQALAQELRQNFVAKSTAYHEIWMNGEKVEESVPSEEVEPIYGKVYLPRKFKMGIMVPPRNDIDILTHDLGFIPHFPNGEVEGYTLYVGGGFGMTHGKDDTYPTLSQPLMYVPRDKTVQAAIAIVTAQRDYGNRENRKRARLRYLLEEKGLEWFRTEVESRLDFKPEDPKPIDLGTVSDPYGWFEQGDGKLFCSVWVQDGRIKDTGTVNYKSGFREIVETFRCPIRLTPNCSIIFHDLDPARKDEFDAILAKHGIPHADDFTEARKLSMACVALPTCGLALAESERALPGVMDQIDAILKREELEDEPILIRMTGCPNGCARPYNADIGFVGRGPERYALFVGGSFRGERLGVLWKHTVTTDEIPEVVEELLREFKENRKPSEPFSDYWVRAHGGYETPRPEQFHQAWESTQGQPVS
ncbi:MAG: NADPH-dependent assimilatory sulfite reductase hemoprotein subunit [Candidatus Omnitrophica bacterium]|nr:NADPH-dependent assimilatory sulfite reductase hemoprotein subunit [Candidatus Omnitrophota bacterium]